VKVAGSQGKRGGAPEWGDPVTDEEHDEGWQPWVPRAAGPSTRAAPHAPGHDDVQPEREDAMKVRDVYTKGLIPATSDDTVLEAAVTMEEHEVGCLPVFRSDDLVGILTERDLVHALADGAHPETTTIGEYMSLEPVTVGIDADLHDAATEMLNAGVRHLPVIDAGEVVGMVSIRDVIVEQAWEVSQA